MQWRAECAMIPQNRNRFHSVGGAFWLLPAGSHRELTLKNSRKHPFLFILASVLAVLGLLLADSAFHLSTETYILNCETLPPGFDGFRIVQLSDLHECSFGRGNRRLVRQVEKAEPDLIAVTGDLADRAGEEDYIRGLMTQLSDIAPTYYVSGNHEWASHIMPEVTDALERSGVTVLDQDFRRLTREGDSLLLVGLCDPNGPASMDTPEEVLARAKEKEGSLFTVLLAHRNRIGEYGELGAELTLCGHAHGGLVRLPGTDGLIDTGRNWFPTGTSGIYEHSGASVLVSRGLCYRFPFVRFLNRPHIPLVILSRQ